MPTKQLTKEETRRHLDRLLISGEIIITQHAKKESMIGRSFYTDDVKYVIRYGDIKSIFYDDYFENWKIEIEGEDLEGVGLTVVVGMDIESGCIRLITGFSPRWKQD